MARLSILTNPNKLTEAKTNLFCDYFIFFSNYLGKMYETELENPLSLISKILFQLTKNPHTAKVDYIEKYMSHEYFTKDIKQYSSYKLLKPTILEFKNIEDLDKNKEKKKKLKWLKESKIFQTQLEFLKAELEQSMLLKSLDAIITYSLCNHEIEKHAIAIKYHTKIIVTELLFIGMPLSEIKNLFDRILSKNVDSFPFPKEVLTKDEKYAFLKVRDFKKQFYGIYNFYTESFKEEFILLKVFGAKLSGDALFNYNGIEFMSPNNKKIEAVKKKLNRVDKISSRKYFSGNEFLIASIPVKNYHSQPHIEEVLIILRDAVNYMSLIFEKTLVVNSDSYITTSDFLDSGWKIGWSKSVKEIKENDLERLNDNPFDAFKDFKSPAISHFLNVEKIFINAMLYNDIEGFWRYLETLFSNVDSSKKITEIVATLILKNENLIRKMHTRSYIVNFSIPWNFDYSKYKLSPSEFLILRNEVINNKTANFYSKIDYPFVNELHKIESKKLTEKRYIILKDFYSKIFLELYENRNSIAHANNFDEKSYIKLKNTIPNLLIRLRWVLFDLFKKYPKHRFNDIVNIAISN